LNKVDRVLDEELDAHCQEIIDALNWTAPVFKIAAINGQGTRELMFAIMEFLEAQRQVKKNEQS
jgi:GTP-binding protein